MYFYVRTSYIEQQTAMWKVPFSCNMPLNMLVITCWNKSNHHAQTQPTFDDILSHSMGATKHLCVNDIRSMIWSGPKPLRHADKKRELQVSPAAFVQVAEKKNQSY